MGRAQNRIANGGGSGRERRQPAEADGLPDDPGHVPLADGRVAIKHAERRALP